MTDEERSIQRDRMRFIKNKTSANLAIIAIVFDVFYFVSIYKSDVGSFYYQLLIGASIVYNLLFMLAAFLCEEGVKNYMPQYNPVLMLLATGQVLRIFILPMKAHKATALINGVETQVMGNGQYFRVCAYLLISFACLAASAIINMKKCRELQEHLKSMEAGKA